MKWLCVARRQGKKKKTHTHSGSEIEKGDQSPEIGSIYVSCFPSEAGIVAEF